MHLKRVSNYSLRIIYIVVALVTIPIGLATRKRPLFFHSFIAEYGGDTLWALLFFLLFRIIYIHKRLWVVAIITYAFCVFIEISQLYEAAWFQKWRDTFLGQMILGRGFLWSDLICYAVGITFGIGPAYMIEKKKL